MMVLRGAGGVPGAVFVVAVTAVAWLLAAVLVTGGYGDVISHHGLLEGRALPTVGAFALFLLA